MRNIIDQYKKLGLYENTIFVIYGDHGEAFGEHGVKGHDGVVYEEGLKVPLIIHDPQRWQGGERIGADAPVNHTDIPPTILDLLDDEVTNGEYPGVSALKSPEDRTLYFNCRPDLQCMASIRGYRKYIYYYGKQPEEFYDLENDPLEKNDIAAKIPPSEIEQRRNDLLEWRSQSAATFEKAPPESE